MTADTPECAEIRMAWEGLAAERTQAVMALEAARHEMRDAEVGFDAAQAKMLEAAEERRLRAQERLDRAEQRVAAMEAEVARLSPLLDDAYAPLRAVERST